MFEQTFKNIDDILHKDAGCGNELGALNEKDLANFIKLQKTKKDSENSCSINLKDLPKGFIG